MGQLKSHEYDKAMLSQMAQRLNAIVYAMGFPKITSSDILVNLSRWIKEQFGDFSMQEVSLAFDLVTAKKIGSDIRHYNTFSQQYVGEVLNSYKEYRNKQVKLHKESEANKLLLKPIQVPTGKEMYDGIKRIALQEGKLMKVADWSSAYNYAWKENLIHRMSKEERSNYKDKLLQALKSESRAKMIPDSFNLNDSIQSECHKRILHAHFQELIDENNQGRVQP